MAALVETEMISAFSQMVGGCRVRSIAVHKLKVWFRGWDRWYSSNYRCKESLRNKTDSKLEVTMTNKTRTDADGEPDWVNPANARNGIVNLMLSKPNNRLTISALYHQVIIWAHVTSCHSQNAFERNSR